MKNRIYIYLIILLLCIGIVLFYQNQQIKNLFQNGTTSKVNEILSMQKEINQKLEKIKKNTKYTLENAYIELNPYKISPLSAIIIFQTNDKEKIEVYLNQEYILTSEENNIHTIPIYGLHENTENIIKLKSSDKEIDYKIQTEKSNLASLNILENNNTSKHDELYFMTASYISGLSAYDQDGNLRFYLTEPYRMDIEWLENGHFIIGIPEGQYAENFYGFVEMDYLGKIYNYYTLEHGFSFEAQILNNGNYLIAGGENPVYINKQVITEINPQNGKTINKIDIYDIFKRIDPEFPDKYLAQAAIRNGFYYDEKTKDLIVSFRGINTIFCLNYETKQLKWIFTNPQNEVFQKDIWQPYMVTSKENDYPWGQHAPIITQEGYIAFFNNDYDRYHGFEVGGYDSVSHYSDNYSRAEIYEIKNNIAIKIWQYDENESYFSHQYGSIKINDQNQKLINFGWTLKSDYREKSNATLSNSEKNIDNTYAYIVELDEKDNTIFKATIEEGKYRVFKHTIYDHISTNIDFTTLQEYNTIPKENLNKKNRKELKNVKDWIYNGKITQNYFETNYDIKETDEIEFYFLNESGKVSSMIYKEKEDPITKRIFALDLPHGKYKFYIKINGIVWNTNTIIEF